MSLFRALRSLDNPELLIYALRYNSCGRL